jgi:isopentenyl diphosphate isomerase/L-lactate dehydrogenase-like FMN-dependent dehydrogenase
MGNAQARQRLRGSDFHYLSKFTAFANNEVRKYTDFSHIRFIHFRQVPEKISG